MSNAAATMVGQLGAGKPDRAEKAVWLTGFYNMCFLGAIGLFFVVCSPWLVSFFSSEPEADRVCDGLPENGRMRVSLYALWDGDHPVL